MRILVFSAMLLSVVQHTAAQQGPPEIYRGPYANRIARLVEPPNGLPLTFSRAEFSITPLPIARATLRTSITSRTLRSVPVSGITLRAAFGPTRDGMITFRLRPIVSSDTPPPLARLTPNGPPLSLGFSVVQEDPMPGIMALSRDMELVFTLERIEGDESQLIFENPNATELLWEALGKPSFSAQ
jgi:hypothetical protein